MPTDTDAEKGQVVLLDTSTAILLVVEGREAHDATLGAVRGRRLGLAGRAWFGTFAVLTRLPGGLRRSPADVARLLVHNVPASGHLGEAESIGLGRELAGLGISGGAVYDALVGAAARPHQPPLLSGDARVRPIYQALGVRVEFVG